MVVYKLRCLLTDCNIITLACLSYEHTIKTRLECVFPDVPQGRWRIMVDNGPSTGCLLDLSINIVTACWKYMLEHCYPSTPGAIQSPKSPLNLWHRVFKCIHVHQNTLRVLWLQVSEFKMDGVTRNSEIPQFLFRFYYACTPDNKHYFAVTSII